MDARPWLKSYPPGVRWDAPLTLTPVQEILETAAKRFADRPALRFMGKRITYAELDALADRAAAGFQRLGVGPGVRVGLYLPNTPHYPIAFFGVLKAGGVIVNYSPLDAPAALARKVDDSETDVIVTLDVAALYPQMERLLGATRLKKLVVGEIAEMTPAPDLVRAQMAGAGQLASVPFDERRLAFRDLIDNDGRYRPYPIDDPRAALAALQYTGGTTGEPKAAMLTHANLSAASAQYYEMATRGDTPSLREGEERILVVLPLFHIFAISCNMNLGLKIGAELILHTRFDAAAVVKEIVESKVTSMPGVPTMYVAINSIPGVESLDLTSLKYCSSGGAPLPLPVQKRFQELAGCRLTEGWGMTETSPAGSYTPVHGPVKPGSCGIPAPGVDFKFVDVADPDRTLPMGERGEVCVRGPNVTIGYWKRPDATRQTMTKDGFLRTGDVGYMDSDGYLFLVDRTKDMLLCGGYNVYPRTIEEAVYRHPAVDEVSVIGVPDEYRGQSPKAFIKLKPGAVAPTLDELKEFLKDKLGKHEMIGALEIRPDLPKTPVGKLSKKELYAEEEERRRVTP